MFGDPEELKGSETTVQFIFTSLKIALGMKQTQIGGLLANNHKYLAHMCIKGLKGKDFKKIINWYKLIYDNISIFFDLLHNELDQFKNTLDVLKCGFYSQNFKVVNKCTQVFTKIV